MIGRHPLAVGRLGPPVETKKHEHMQAKSSTAKNLQASPPARQKASKQRQATQGQATQGQPTQGQKNEAEQAIKQKSCSLAGPCKQGQTGNQGRPGQGKAEQTRQLEGKQSIQRTLGLKQRFSKLKL